MNYLPISISPTRWNWTEYIESNVVVVDRRRREESEVNEKILTQLRRIISISSHLSIKCIRSNNNTSKARDEIKWQVRRLHANSTLFFALTIKNTEKYFFAKKQGKRRNFTKTHRNLLTSKVFLCVVIISPLKLCILSLVGVELSHWK